MVSLVLYALTSEKAAAAIERENKITFIVEDRATKPELKKEIEELKEKIVHGR